MTNRTPLEEEDERIPTVRLATMGVQRHKGNWVSTTFGILIQGLAFPQADGHLSFFYFFIFFRPPMRMKLRQFTNLGKRNYGEVPENIGIVRL